MLSFMLLVASWTAVVDEEGPSFDVRQTDVALSIDVETRRIVGVAALHLEARAKTKTVVVTLNDRLAVTAVRDGDREVDFAEGANFREGRGIVVELARSLERGKSRVLTIEYEGEAMDPGPTGPDWMGILLVRPDEIRMSHQSQWFPTVPPDASAMAKMATPMRLELDLPAGMSSLGPGRLESVVASGPGREKHVHVSERLVRGSILAGTHRAVEVKKGGLAVRVLAPESQLAGGRAWGEEALELLSVMQSLLGGPKTGSYGIASMRVKNRDRSYNYEADGFSVYDGVLFDGRDPQSGKIAHEVGHRWFGGLVDAAGPGERFLTESLAEIAAWLALEERLGEEAVAEASARAAKRYGGAQEGDDALAIASFSSSRYVPIVYGRGPLALGALRAWIGPKKFAAGLNEYIKRHAQAAEPPSLADFVDAMRSKGGDEVDVWATEWLHRAEFPTYEVKLDRKKGNVSGELVQAGAIFHTPAVIELKDANGKTIRVDVEPRGAKTRFKAKSKTEISEATATPRRW